jgi:hypothetical protein
MNTNPKSNKIHHTSRFAILLGVFITVCMIVGFAIFVPSAMAICGSKNPDNNCGSVSTNGCEVRTVSIPCILGARLEHVCNPTYTEYHNQNQWKCTPERVGVQCVESADVCGYKSTGGCVPAGHTTCTVAAELSPEGVQIKPPVTMDFYTACVKNSVAPDNSPVNGGKAAATSADSNCDPTPTPTPDPHQE